MTLDTKTLGNDARRLLATVAGSKVDGVVHLEPFWMNTVYERQRFGYPLESFEQKMLLARTMRWGSVSCGVFGWAPGHRNALTSDGKLRYSGGSILSREELRDLSDPHTDDDIREAAVRLRAAHDHGFLGHIWLSHSFHGTATAMGLERFAYACVDDFGLVKAYVERIEDRNRRVLAALLATGERPDFVWFDGDCAYNSGMMVDPRTYLALEDDQTSATLELLRRSGIPYWFHTDGKVDEIYPILIRWGFTAVHGVQSAANDLAEVKSRFGDDLVLLGNMDSDVLARGGPEEIRARTTRMLEAGQHGGRYIAAVDTSVNDHIPLPAYDLFKRTIECFGSTR